MGYVPRRPRLPFARERDPSPGSEADSGVPTKPGAMRLTRTGAGSRARLAVSAGIAAVTAEVMPRLGPARRPPVSDMICRSKPRCS